MQVLKTLLASTALAATAPVASAQVTFDFSAKAPAEGGDLAIYVGKGAELTGLAAELDASTGGRLTSGMATAEFEGELGEGLKLFDVGDLTNVAIIGTGSETLTRRDLADLGGHAAIHLDDEDGLALMVSGLSTDVTSPSAYIAKGYALGDYTYTTYKTLDEAKPDGTVRLIGADGGAAALYNDDLSYLVRGVALARNLGNAPGNEIYPQTFVDTVREAYRGVGNVSFRVLDEREIERRGMGALLGVGKGSINESRLLVITYRGGERDEAPIALVGKGVTFDTGGISIKSNDNMWRMKADLSGAAAVAGTVLAAAGRGEDINVVGVIPLAENMPSQDAIRPGDVLTTLSGKTIEILNTDAEGRLLLADAVRFAQDEFNPRTLVNIATLTGSAARAAGDEYAVVITRDFDLSVDMMEIGKAAGEDVWPLPLHPNHVEQIKSDIADIKNIGGTPGASIGAAVVGTFVDDGLPWVHLDIAGPFFADEPKPTYPKGHAGWGVRFMDEMLRVESE